MTTPVDHRPYAGPTDLVTAADVAEWLDTLHQGPPAERIFGVQDAIAALDARLERERRQACRRGARMNFADAATLMRCYALNRTLGVIRDTASEDAIAHYLIRALAFRAAARQP